MRDYDAAGTEMTVTDNSVRHIQHHAYACWDTEETRHFYEDILGMPLVATIVLPKTSPHAGAFIATSRSKWRGMRWCGSSSASWMRPA